MSMQATGYPQSMYPPAYPNAGLQSAPAGLAAPMAPVPTGLSAGINPMAMQAPALTPGQSPMGMLPPDNKIFYKIAAVLTTAGALLGAGLGLFVKWATRRPGSKKFAALLGAIAGMAATGFSLFSAHKKALSATQSLQFPGR